MLSNKTLLAALTCTVMTAAASAGTAPISIVSGASHDGVDLSVDIVSSTRTGYDYDFVINNASAAPGASVTGVYFESGWSSLISGGSFGGSGLNAGTDSPAVSGWAGSSSSYTVGQTVVSSRTVFHGRSSTTYNTFGDDIAAGIQEGSSGVFSFSSSASLADLEAALGVAGFNVGVKIQDVVSDSQAAGWGLADSMPVQPDVDPTPVVVTSAPTPTAAAAGLALLGLAGLRRRRRA
ncbi:MAG: MYXO-CTERM sorting domain-containing protein [Planctomycetota bacterium]